MSTNYLEQYGNEMRAIVMERDEFPTIVGQIENLVLYRFEDGTEVIETNAGIVTDQNDGFWEVRQQILEPK